MENSKKKKKKEKKKRKRKNSRLTLSSSARLSQFRGYIYLEKYGKKKVLYEGEKGKGRKGRDVFQPLPSSCYFPFRFVSTFFLKTP